ncbi:MAG: type II toxin-antitoxin system PemK/MazF family toxin [Syntrophomonadaceae bacterium]|nr:type II toxin-antitoxin system PemK/MazF family toxin [Syntrophomonadaceae bacterium]
MPQSGDVWFVNFPLEENNGQFISRPVVVIYVDKDSSEVLSVKVTKTEPRQTNSFDTPITFWQQAKLHYKSTARVSKTIFIPISQFKFKIGTLHSTDFNNIQQLYAKYLSHFT